MLSGGVPTPEGRPAHPRHRPDCRRYNRWDWRPALTCARTLVLFVLAAAAAGCDRPAPDSPGVPAKPAPAAPPAAKTEGDHHHHHSAPHGGVLVALGEHAANVELVLQAGEGKLTAYILDGCAEKPIRITQPTLRLEVAADSAAPAMVELKAVANALTGETVGDTSEFVLTAESLKGAERVSGRIAAVAVRGVGYADVPFVIEKPAP